MMDFPGESLMFDTPEPRPTPRAFFSSTLAVGDTFTGNLSSFGNQSWISDPGGNKTNAINSYFYYETVQFAVMWFLLVAIVTGNSCVIAALLLAKSRKSRMNYFIMQLAIADLLVGIISVLTDLLQRISIDWMFGNMACKVLKFLQAVVTYSSTYVLVALSIDRCDAITHPMNFSGSWKRAKGLIASAWLLSIIFSVPVLILYEEKLVQNQLQCWIELGSPKKWQIWMICVCCTLFVIPALTITACYTVIVLTIWTKSKVVISPPNSSKKLKKSRQAQEDADSRRASSRGLIPRAKIKTVKMTFVIVFVFILCWSPYMVFDLLQVFDCIPRTQTSVAIATLIQSLVPLNSAANPLIYCIFSTHIFNSLRRVPVFRWLCCWSSSGRSRSGRAHADSTTLSEMLTSSHRRRATLLTHNNSTRADSATRTHLINNGCRKSLQAGRPGDAAELQTVGAAAAEHTCSRRVQLVLPSK